jgi:hypothetical protein
MNRVLVLCSLCGRWIPVIDKTPKRGEPIGVYSTGHYNICLVCHINNTLRILINPISVIKIVYAYISYSMIKKSQNDMLAKTKVETT